METEHLYFRACREAMERLGLGVTEEQYRENLLRSARGLWFLAEELGVGVEPISAAKSWRDARYGELIAREPIFIEGVEEALERLARRARLAIVTSSKRSHFETIHARTGYLRRIERCFCLGDYPRHKPYPDPWWHALGVLGVDRAAACAGAAMVVEDSRRGLLSAVAAGVPCAVIPRGLTLAEDFSEAAAKFDRLGELADWMENG